MSDRTKDFSKPRVLVVAGGTTDPIDDVRVLTNVSSGRLGLAISEACYLRGAEVFHLGSRSSLAGKVVHFQTDMFSSSAELSLKLEQVTKDFRPQIVFMSAAVADYVPQKVPRKISSKQPELVLSLQQSPKLLPRIRESLGSGAVIVGFKLLSRVTEDDLFKAAQEQIEVAGVDLVVGNDLQWLREDSHPVLLIGRGECLGRIIGPRQEVAGLLVDRVWQWGRSQEVGKDWVFPPRVVEAASICLFHPASYSVLLGRRMRGAFREHFAFAGGKLERGESVLDAACRELREETGICLSIGQSVFDDEQSFEDETGQVVYRVRYAAVLCAERFEVKPSDEFVGQWVELEEAMKMKLAPGVLPVLSRIKATVH